MSSSCCNGNCGCGSGCKCGSSCGGCKMYPDMSSGEKNATPQTLILGVAPNNRGSDGASESGGAEKVGCMCSPCTCNPCMCH